MDDQDQVWRSRLTDAALPLHRYVMDNRLSTVACQTVTVRLVSDEGSYWYISVTRAEKPHDSGSGHSNRSGLSLGPLSITCDAARLKESRILSLENNKNNHTMLV